MSTETWPSIIPAPYQYPPSLESIQSLDSSGSPSIFQDESQAAIAGIASVAPERVHGDFAEVEVAGGRLKVVRFMDGDPRYTELANRIATRRQERYKADGLLKPEADDKDTIRGSHVEIIAFLEGDEPVVSIRKVHATKLGAIEETPSFAKFAEQGALDNDQVAKLRRISEGRPVVEAAALWKDPKYKNDAALALYRCAIQDSVMRGEIWVVGVVSRAYIGLQRQFGPEVVQSMGKPIAVKGEGADEKVRIYPAFIDTARFYDGLMDGAKKAHRDGDEATRFAREIVLWHFLDGLNLEYLSQDTQQRLERMSNGNVG